MMLARCPWYIAGPLIGLLMVALRAAINRPFGALGGYIDLTDSRLRPAKFGVRAYLLLGLVVGGAAYAALSGTLAPTMAYGADLGAAGGGASQIATLVAAGIVMGVGARTAGGCTSGHGLSGTSLGSPASLAATATFFLTAVLLARLIGVS